MCGIVGLHLRDPELQPMLGRLLDDMLCGVVERGPDSVGIAVYGDGRRSPEGHSAVSVLRPRRAGVGRALLPGTPRDPRRGTPRCSARRSGSRRCAAAPPRRPRRWSSAAATTSSSTRVPGTRRTSPATYGLGDGQRLAGRRPHPHGHRVGDQPRGLPPVLGRRRPVPRAQRLVLQPRHIRRELERQGVTFDSENDSEVGARFVAACLAEGDDLEKALLRLGETFDGFYTLLVTTADGFAVVRDEIACKPAVIAETPAGWPWRRSSAPSRSLPGIDEARVFEPDPGKVYAWQR